VGSAGVQSRQQQQQKCVVDNDDGTLQFYARGSKAKVTRYDDKKSSGRTAGRRRR
jgi:hypothetical protein